MYISRPKHQSLWMTFIVFLRLLSGPVLGPSHKDSNIYGKPPDNEFNALDPWKTVGVWYMWALNISKGTLDSISHIRYTLPKWLFLAAHSDPLRTVASSEKPLLEVQSSLLTSNMSISIMYYWVTCYTEIIIDFPLWIIPKYVESIEVRVIETCFICRTDGHAHPT